MKKQILIRNIPDELKAWIDLSRQEYCMSQQDFILSTLKQIKECNQPSLYSLDKTYTNPNNTIPFTFIDLFAGIGGFRLALEKLGGKCVFSSEWDIYCQKTYKAWFGDIPAGDITKIRPDSIPDHDILAAGFPCQPFSIAGVSKKNSLGRPHGFKDVIQGTLFFNLASIIEIKKPAILFLENVKNLRSHDQGRTWSIIQDTLHNLGYWVFSKVIDASGWVPQHRERFYIICFNKELFPEKPIFEYPIPSSEPRTVLEILENNVDSKYTLTDHLWQYLQEYAKKHKEKGNGFGYGLVDPNGITRTLSARYFKDGSEILIPQGKKNPRRLTPRECAKLMGFDDELPIVVSDTQAYKQFGNAVVPKVVEAIGKQIVKIISLCWYQGDYCLLRRQSIYAKGITNDVVNV